MNTHTRSWVSMHRILPRVIAVVVCAVVVFGVFVSSASAATGVPRIMNYQGRLMSSGGSLLGGSSGTDYCVKFSIYDNATVGSGSKLWPSGSPSTMTVNVKSGIFNAGVGDTNAGGDTLDFDFESNDAVYLNVEVASKVGATCAPGDGAESFENLSPRQRVTASGYAINSATLNGQTGSFYRSNSYSTTSAAYDLSTYSKGYFFSTTSVNYWDASQSRWATTSSDAWFATKTTDNLPQGSTNLYYSNSAVNGFIAGSSSIPKTFANNSFTGTNSFTGDVTLANATTSNFNILNTISGAGLVSCSGSSDKLVWNASTRQFGCGADAGAGGGLTALGAEFSTYQTGSSQTLATSSDTNIGITITSSGDTHTFTPSWIGTLSGARGGTGIGSISQNGILIGAAGNTWSQVSTSSLGLPTFATLASYLDFAAWYATTTDALAEGSTNKYFTSNRVAGVIAGTTTDALAEGSTNKYYTDNRVQSYLNSVDKGYFFSTTSAVYFNSQNPGASFSTTSADFWKTQNSFHSTTSFAFNLSTYDTGYFFSTTSVNYWESTQNRWATTSTDYWFSTKSTSDLPEGTNLYYTSSRVAGVIAGTTTDALAEGATNKYYQDSRVATYINGSSTIPNRAGGAYGDLLSWTGSAWQTTATSSLGLPTFASLSTYFTLANWYATTTDALDEGVNNLYFTPVRVATVLAGTTTDAIAEGSTNKYYTDNRVQTFLNTISKGYFFSTTSASSFASAGLAFSTTSTDYWKTQNNFHSTTSFAYNLSTYDNGSFFSTTSVNFWESTQNRWATTSSDYWLSTKSTSDLPEGTNLYYTDNRVNSFIAGSSTIPKTFANNTFIGVNTFANIAAADATTTSLFANILSTPSAIFGRLTATTTNATSTIAGSLLIGTSSGSYKVSVLGATTAGTGATGTAIMAISNDDNTLSSGNNVLRLNIRTPYGTACVTGTTCPRFTEYFAGVPSGSDTGGRGVGSLRLSTAGTGITQTSGSADFAEYMQLSESAAVGDIVSLNSSGEYRKATAGEALIGVVSDNPAFVGNGNLEGQPNAYIVGFAGVIQTTVSDANGDINAGDLIAASDVPGVGIKLSKSGYALGQALQSYSGPGVGTITVLVMPKFVDATIALESYGGGASGASGYWDLSTSTNTVSLASSTYALAVSGNSTLGSATSSSLKTNVFSLGGVDYFTSLTGSGLVNSGGLLALDRTGDWTGTLDGRDGSYYLANAFSTTSAAYFASAGLAFSTTSAQYFASQNGGQSYSTTSTDYHLSTYDKGYFFSTTSTDFWKSQTNFFSTTSTDFWKTQNNFFSTTSASYFSSLGLAFSTTSAQYFLGQNDSSFSSSSANYFLNSSTTVPKTYSNNTYTGTNDFQNVTATNATTTTSFTGTASSTNLFSNIANIGSLIAGAFTGNVITATNATTTALYSDYASTTDIKTNTASAGSATVGSLTLGNALTGGNGGTGLNSVVQGSLLIGGAGNTWTQVSTSSLGLPTFANLASYLGLSAWYSTTTDALAEGITNKYYTDARVASVIAGTTTDALGEGATNKYFTNNRVAGVIAGTTTDALAEGATNKYYNDSLVQSYLNGINKGFFFSTTSSDAWLSTKTFASFSTTSADYWKTQNNFHSTTSFAFNLSTYDTGYFFSTTSVNYWETMQSRWATTSSDAWLATKSTSDLPEGTNLYYTPNRVAGVIAGTTTDALTEGTNNKYFTNNRVAGVIAGTTTDALAEGATNKYYQDSRVATYINGSSTIPNRAGSAFGDLLTWSGSAWQTSATSSFGLPTFANLASYLGLSAWYSTTTDALAEGITNKYYTDARVASVIAGTTTDAIAEGSTNKYYTDNRVQTFLNTISKGYFFSTTSASSFASAGLAFSTTSTDYWKTQNNFHSTTSFAYNLSTYDNGSFFSTTSVNFWESTQNRWATTSSDYWLSTKSTSDLPEGTNLYYTSARVAGVIAGTTTDALAEGSTNQYFTNGRVNGFIASSSTIPKTFANNTFTGTNSFGNITATGATTTSFSTSQASTTNLTVSGVSNGLLSTGADGVVQATTFSGPLSYNGGILTLTQSGAAQNGYVSSTDWNSFNSRLSTSTLALIDKGFFFSTTSSQYFTSVGLGFSTTSSDAHIAASSSVVTTYKNNTFIGVNAFANITATGATTTTLFSGIASSTNIFASSARFGSLGAFSLTGSVAAAANSITGINVASTTDLWISNIRNGLLSTNGQGTVVASSTPTAASFNATSNTVASQLPYASSTAISVLQQLSIGAANGTILQGGATGTSTIAGVLNVSGTNSTSTFSGGLEATRLNLTNGTSTAAGGFNLSSGCYAVNGVCISGAVNSVSATNTTLTVNPNAGNVGISLNLSNPNIWTGLQQFGNATTSLLEATQFYARTITATSSNALSLQANAGLTFGSTTAQMLAVTPSTNRVTLGTGGANPSLLVLDTKNTSGDPTGVDGSMYFNSNISAFRCYNGGWVTCGGQAASSTGDVQFRNIDGSFTATSNFNWSQVGNSLTLTGSSTSQTLDLFKIASSSGRIMFGINGMGVMALSTTTEPTTPPSGELNIYAREIAGRVMPKWIGPAGVDTPFQASLGFNRTAMIMPAGGATATTFIGGYGTLFTNSVTTAANPTPATTNLLTSTRRATFSTSATANTITYHRVNTLMVTRGNAAGIGGFFYTIRFGTSATQAGNRVFVGMTDSIANPTNVDPTTSGTIGRIGLATNANTGNWKFVQNVAGTAPTVYDLGASFPIDTTSLYELVLYSKPNDTVVTYRVTNLSTGAQMSSTTNTTNLPANTTYLAPQFWMVNVAAAIATFDFGGWYLESDN